MVTKWKLFEFQKAKVRKKLQPKCSRKKCLETEFTRNQQGLVKYDNQMMEFPFEANDGRLVITLPLINWLDYQLDTDFMQKIDWDMGKFVFSLLPTEKIARNQDDTVNGQNFRFKANQRF